MTCLRFLSTVPVHVVEQKNFTPLDFRLSLYEAKQEITGLCKMHNNFDCLMEQSKPVTSPKNQGKNIFLVLALTTLIVIIISTRVVFFRK